MPIRVVYFLLRAISGIVRAFIFKLIFRARFWFLHESRFSRLTGDLPCSLFEMKYFFFTHCITRVKTGLTDKRWSLSCCGVYTRIIRFF